MTNNNQPWYVSSTGEGLSMTIKGVLIGAIPLIIFIGQQFNIELTQEYLTLGIQMIAELVTVAVVAVGLIRKIANWIKIVITK